MVIYFQVNQTESSVKVEPRNSFANNQIIMQKVNSFTVIDVFLTDIVVVRLVSDPET